MFFHIKIHNYTFLNNKIHFSKQSDEVSYKLQSHSYFYILFILNIVLNICSNQSRGATNKHNFFSEIMSSYDVWVKMKVMWYQKCLNSQYLFKKNIIREK